ncbi:MAG: nickel-dependent lactate racemase [Pyrinomonadaceae bacterium]|nr:nickel-dependent lactate racemase [Pyrinomonadaceae bacterium]
MPQIELAYGSGSVAFAFDEDRYQVLRSDDRQDKPLTDVQIGEAMDLPFESAPLEEILSAGEPVLIVVSDATRATGSAQIVNLLVRRIIQNGIEPQNIAIIFSTGIHRAVSSDEKRDLLTPFIFQRIKTIDHDAHDPSKLVVVGETRYGTPVEVNRALQEFPQVILTGAIGFHYFAGFTGGRKSICPGLASAQTIKATHMLALDFETGGRRAGVGTGLLDGNAVHEACESIGEMINPSFGINSVVDELGRPVRVLAGHWRGAHRAACQEYLATHSVSIENKREVVVASCGGFPYDINLIQAHKALDMAAQACNEGGTIVLLAECREGFGRNDFLKWFDEENSSCLAGRLRRAYEVNGQTAWALLTKAERYRVLLLSTLPDQDVKQMRMTPVHSLDEVLAQLDPAAHGYILPRGAACLPVNAD